MAMHRLHNLFLLLAVLLLGATTATADTPNVLFIIADDASRHFGQAYGCDWVKTPNIDRLAQEGLVFDKLLSTSPGTMAGPESPPRR